jgi:DNA invertase Pin-like site-specific DNA recombinase
MSSPSSRVPRKTALCYVRLSYTKDESDRQSPERQRANIQRICDREGWIPEWYEDADGHKSGRYVKNRPGWLELEKRLKDPDVVGLVSNDSGRMHRRSWRVGYLLDQMDEYGLRLILALQDREYDASDPMDRMLLTFMAMQDEAYANDIAAKAKDSVRYRKSLGKTIGMPPFGTIRNEAGYLIPSPYGAWLLPDGSWAPGEVGQEPPEEGALWRGYYDAAGRVLALYIKNLKGRDKVAYQMIDEGWAFRTRTGNPRPFNKDDVRRITSSWPQYAGLSPEGSAKDFNPNLADDPVGILYDTGRQVFPIELLRKVAKVHIKRGGVRRPPGSQGSAHPYALTRLLYCAQCERNAEEQNNPAQRTRISGHDRGGQLRYRHAEGVKCGCKRKSVKIAVIEDDFARLIRLLTIDEEKLPVMVELAAQVAEGSISDEDFDAQKAAAIAKAQRRIENARFLFLEGDIAQDEYLRRKEHNERQIAHWEARTTESEKAAIEIRLCMEALEQLAGLWDTATDEDRQQLARMLFEYIVYDLDRQQIVDFRLKPWADHYLVLRAALYGDDDLMGVPVDDDGGDGDSGGTEADVSTLQSGEKDNRSYLKTRTDYCPIGAYGTGDSNALQTALHMVSFCSTSRSLCPHARSRNTHRPSIFAMKKSGRGMLREPPSKPLPDCLASHIKGYPRYCTASESNLCQRCVLIMNEPRRRSAASISLTQRCEAIRRRPIHTRPTLLGALRQAELFAFLRRQIAGDAALVGVVDEGVGGLPDVLDNRCRASARDDDVGAVRRPIHRQNVRHGDETTHLVTRSGIPYLDYAAFIPRQQPGTIGRPR